MSIPSDINKLTESVISIAPAQQVCVSPWHYHKSAILKQFKERILSGKGNNLL